MRDKPEDYGEVIYRWVHKEPDADFAIENVLVKGDNCYQFGHRLADKPDTWTFYPMGEPIRFLLSVIADKDKALNVIIGLGQKYCHESERDELSAMKRPRQMITAANTALNQPKEQHGKA
jgi:hypothetical protein